MNNIDVYLRHVIKGTYLRKREREAWIEEMQSHLKDSVKYYRVTGLSDEQAHQRAITSFGTPKELRQQIVRETFMMPPRWFMVAAVLCLLSLGVALFTNMRFDDVVVSTGNPYHWEFIHNYKVVTWLHHYFPLNPARWAALGIMCFMMIFTRKQTDRLAVLVSWIPCCVALLPSNISLTSIIGSQRVIFSAFPIIQSVNIASIYEFVMLILFGALLYLWTDNRVISLTPWLISMTLTTYAFVWRTVQSTLWKWTQNPIFWGQAPVSWGDIWNTFSSLLVHFIGAVLVLHICRHISAKFIRRVKVVV
ncbi:permease prefix domain 1-containing protein [Alicyclobacillus fodiniaquatilis]|uniref:Permease prefix domain 1-containing protein n=1 Tax=Alicyclobacillus fodiniaquatilis TaxID=1661150 RepID=A0ABW4JDB9_9BACL